MSTHCLITRSHGMRSAPFSDGTIPRRCLPSIQNGEREFEDEDAKEGMFESGRKFWTFAK